MISYRIIVESKSITPLVLLALFDEADHFDSRVEVVVPVDNIDDEIYSRCDIFPLPPISA